MLKILKKLNVLLDAKQKRTMIIMVIMMIIGAILEACSISLIIPVIEVVIDENAVEKYEIVRVLYNGLHMQNLTQFALVIMSALIVTFVVKNIYLYWQQKFMYHFVYTNQFRTSERMMKNYLRKGYEFYLNADTAVIQRNITSDVNNMYALILSILQLVSESIVFVFLLGVLLLSDWMMTAMIAVLLIVTLWVIKSVIKPIMHKAGEDNQNYYSGLFKWISQTVQGIKEVKIAGKEQYFTDEYIKCGKGYVDAVQKYTLYNSIPRLLIETICIIGMVSYMMLLVATGRDFTEMMPILSAFSVAAIRLMPCANRINNQLTSMAFYQPFFMGVSDNLQDEISGKNTDMSFAKETDKKLPIHESITMRDVTYHYPNSEVLIFDHADMEIPIGASVGIVGASGAGKTTVVDILLGLLEVQTGGVYADDVNIKDEYRSWLKNVGYIPQLIFMLDDTILKNVAFGVPEDEIDMDRVWEVLKEAQMDEFVRGLPEGLNTGIGERGIRISGGQRQRLGIARALYYDPEVLILDEATSALDNDTEAAIMDAINSLQGRKTLIIIAHRLQTIEKCDMIYRVEGGKAVVERKREND
ncbi:MAG: ABC transporter ATP-binding protein [Lachnospiraceae bacterium]|nr:ABC transporter ATP-binding protein [Lachnospiraceae bacterium]